MILIQWNPKNPKMSKNLGQPGVTDDQFRQAKGILSDTSEHN